MTFKELVVSREAVVSSTPHAKIYHSTLDFSGVSSSETSDKETESEVETPVRGIQIDQKVQKEE